MRPDRRCRLCGFNTQATDGTSRRQIQIQNCVISGQMQANGPIISVCMRLFLPAGGTSEQECEAIISKVLASGALRLERWAAKIKELHPDFEHDIPDKAELNIAKLGGGGALSTDTCDQARKLRRLLRAEIAKAVELRCGGRWAAMSEAEQKAAVYVVEIDCWQHLRNVWLDAMIGALTKFLNTKLEASLSKFDARSRVSADLSALIRAIDKNFSAMGNYAKGHGAKEFAPWLQLTYPSEFLLKVVRANGSRQDICVEGAVPIFVMRTYYLEYLDYKMRAPGFSNILEEYLFAVLSSAEMLAATRVAAIIDIAISKPVRWLAAKTEHLASQDWSVASMARVIDALEAGLKEIEADGSKLLNKSFMYHLFDSIVELLEDDVSLADQLGLKRRGLWLSDYLTLIQQGGETRSFDRTKKFKKGDEVSRRLFAPALGSAVAATNEMCSELAVICATALLAELRDKKKATAGYLLSADGAMAWGTAAAQRAHEATKGVDATNNAAERFFAGFTEYYNSHGNIAVASAAGVVISRANDDHGLRSDSRVITAARKGKNIGKAEAGAESGGLVRQLPVEMREALVRAAQQHLTADIERDAADLAAQHECVRLKEELAQQKGAEKHTELFIERLYYFEMWRSPRCLKTLAAVDKALQKLAETRKVAELKEQIRIRVVGLAWEDLKTAWSKGGDAFGSAHLLAHLKLIIAEQSKRPIPTTPPVPIMERKALQQLGTEALDKLQLDAKQRAKSGEFEKACRVEKSRRESDGVGDSYENMQPVKAPTLTLGMRLERLCWYNYTGRGDGEDGDFMWCACTVIATEKVPKGPRSVHKDGEAVLVRWDANDRVEPPEVETESAFRILPSKWSKSHGEGAWRLDLDHISRGRRHRADSESEGSDADEGET